MSPLDRFPLAPSQALPRIIASSWGSEGTGKSWFWLTAPPPVVVLSLDQGTEGVVEEFRQACKDIRVVNYDWAPSAEESFTQEQAIRLRRQFIDDYQAACACARTVVWDKETDVWNLFRYAEFGAPKADVPKDFDKVNTLMRKYLQLPKKLTINFGAIQSCKDEWVSQSKKSGARVRAGFSETPGLLHIDLFHERINGRFFTTIGKVRGPHAQSLTDQQFENLDIPTLGMMLFPNADEAIWGV